MTEASRSPLLTLGRIWGTFGSCDEIDNLCWIFYDFQQPPSTRGPFPDTAPADLLVNYDLGTCELQDPEGNSLQHWDLGELLPQLEKAPKP